MSVSAGPSFQDTVVRPVKSTGSLLMNSHSNSESAFNLTNTISKSSTSPNSSSNSDDRLLPHGSVITANLSVQDQDVGYQNLLISDQLVFNNFKCELSQVKHLAQVENVELQGYESYLVEQWISKRLNKKMIVIYTGNSTDVITVHRIRITNYLPSWPPRFRSYIEDLYSSKYLSSTETDHGIIFITNLAQLDSSLTLIPIPKGDFDNLYIQYVVNYNLKKLGCSPRSTLVTSEPSKSVEDKFKTLFKIPTEIPLCYAAREIICIMQTFLYYYNVLEPQYCDGLFCEKTENAVIEWWRLISSVRLGNILLKYKPPNCTISTSIVTVIGFTLLLKSILELTNTVTVPKDPLDSERFTQSVRQFQKSQKISSSRYPSGFLDHDTISKLIEFSTSNKFNQNFTKDLTKMKNLVKSTVIDFTAGKTLSNLNLSTPLSQNNSNKETIARRFMSCQDGDQISKACTGRRMSYLYNAKGKESNLNICSLAAYTRQEQVDHKIFPAHSRNASASTTTQEQDSSVLFLNKSVSNQVSEENEVESACSTYQLPLNRQRSKTLIIGGNFQDTEDHSMSESARLSEWEEENIVDAEEDIEGNKFEQRLKRRHSIPCIERELNIHTIEVKALKEDDEINRSVLYSTPTFDNSLKVTLKRSNSFSFVEEDLVNNDTYSDGFESNLVDLVSTEKLAMQYLHILNRYKLGVLKYSNDHKRRINTIKMDLLNEFNVEQRHSQLSNSNLEYGKVLKKYHDFNEKYNTNYKVNARLKYELRLLLQKTNEVETNLKALEEFKIKALQHSFDQMSDCIQAPQLIEENIKKLDTREIRPMDFLSKPYLIVFLICNYLRRFWMLYFGTVENPRIEERWNKIDKNKKVTKFLEKVCREGGDFMEQEEGLSDDSATSTAVSTSNND